MTNAEELKSSGLKATLPRIKILEIFQRAQQRHMTAEDVYKVLLLEGADIGLAFDGDADRVFVVDEQGIGISGSATTALVAAGVANDGVIMEPHVVSEIRDGEGELHERVRLAHAARRGRSERNVAAGRGTHAQALPDP